MSAKERDLESPDVHKFIPAKGKGRAVQLMNGNKIELWEAEGGGDWLFIFRNVKNGQETILRLSPEALYLIAAMAHERIKDGSLPVPAESPEAPA